MRDLRYWFGEIMYDGHIIIIINIIIVIIIDFTIIKTTKMMIDDDFSFCDRNEATSRLGC